MNKTQSILKKYDSEDIGPMKYLFIGPKFLIFIFD